MPTTVSVPTSIFGTHIFGRVKTDSGVIVGTTLRLLQEFYGGGANGRVSRDGNTYAIQAFRRV
jgi:hypothetical protein